MFKTAWSKSGASKLNAANLSCKSCNVTATGASAADVNVSDSIDANASGVSHITVKGKPKNKKSHAASFTSTVTFE